VTKSEAEAAEAPEVNHYGWQVNGAVVRAIRESHGWSMEDLAHKCKVSWTTVQRMETGRVSSVKGRTRTREETLERVATALGVEVSLLKRRVLSNRRQDK